MAGHRLATVLVLACVAAACAHDLEVPADLEQNIQTSSRVGRRIWVLDMAALVGTDTLLEHVPDPKAAGLGGYLPLPESFGYGPPQDSLVVLFYTDEFPQRVRYQVRVFSGAPPIFEEFDPPAPITPDLSRLIRARELALAARPPTKQLANPVVLPGALIGEDAVLVYVLAGTKQSGLAIFGRHFKARVSVDGTKLLSMTPLSKSELEVPTRNEAGDKVVSLVVSHLVTEYPLETHVFTSLLIQVPVYVSTRRGVWRVDGDKIDLIGPARGFGDPNSESTHEPR